MLGSFGSVCAGPPTSLEESALELELVELDWLDLLLLLFLDTVTPTPTPIAMRAATPTTLPRIYGV